MNDSIDISPKDPLVLLPGYALRRAANAMMADLSERLTELDLRVTDATVMLLIDAGDRITSSDIGRMLDIQRANMVPILARLEGRGLIAREPIDRKSLAVVLTPAGRERVKQVQAIVTRFEADLIERVPAPHREHLLPALDSLWR